MDVTFTEAIREMGPEAAFTLINGARPAPNYVLSRFLPERNLTTYHVESGSMTIRPTMAGLVGMDSPYPPVGAIDVSTFLESTAKIAADVTLPERALRVIQDMLMRVRLGGGAGLREMVQEATNFTQAMIVQPHLDTTEHLRGQALATGALNWTFNGKSLVVDYGVPTANKLTARTGTAGYGGTASVFWSDIRAAMQVLKYDVAAILMHWDTLNVIISNAANNIQITAQDMAAPGVMRVTAQRMITQNGVNTPASDVRDRVELIGYGLEGEVLDPANPGATVKVPFFPRGKVTLVGNSMPTGYVVGAGAQVPEVGALGYTHIGPTVEGNGRAGRWARIYTPEGQPWQLKGQSASNLLPVLEYPEKVAILTTEMPA